MYNREKIINILHEIKKESEEILPYVVIGQPRRDDKEIPAQNFDTGEQIHLNLNGFSHGYISICGEKVDVARNYIIDQAIESGAKYLFFIGDDTIVPYDAFITLHKTAEKNQDSIVTGVYYFKASVPMIMIKENNHIIPADVKPGQVFEAWQTGLDCCLIPIKILKEIKEKDPEIPFCCVCPPGLEGLPFVGEDNYFQFLIRKYGYKTLVNTDCQAIHVDLASGQYTAYPDIDLNNYFTNITLTEPFSIKDKQYIDKRWNDRLPE